MNFLVAYDVATHDAEGQRRLRRVAKLCEGFGQRVQYSLFEVVCTRAKMVELLAKLEDVIDERADSIRVYPLDSDSFGQVIRLGQRREMPADESWVL